MVDSNAGFAPLMEGSHACFLQHMEHRLSFRDKKYFKKIANSANFPYNFWKYKYVKGEVELEAGEVALQDAASSEQILIEGGLPLN